MEKLGIGFCKDGYYEGWDKKGIASQEACNVLCLSEKQCKFAAWMPKKTCSRYTGAICYLQTATAYQRLHTTFEKKSSGILQTFHKRNFQRYFIKLFQNFRINEHFIFIS